ncbi:MAG TPA: hypothetical protein VEC16_06275 [Alphaproteobacteria bacterium]|nr:hypothetical protein [Alphaproteobacteria bacterium]
MHKKGVEYYRALFNHAVYISNSIIENAKNHNRFDQLTNGSMRTITEKDMLPVVAELHNHAKNVLAHIQTEENIMKKFAYAIQSKLNINIGDPRMMTLTRVMQELVSLERSFKGIEEETSKVLPYLEESYHGQKVMAIYEAYYDINSYLATVESISKRVSKDIYEILSKAQAEREFIVKEEDIFEDFKRNLMSWF